MDHHRSVDHDEPRIEGEGKEGLTVAVTECRGYVTSPRNPTSTCNRTIGDEPD